MHKIAILTSTRPLRERTQEIGRTVETLSPRVCNQLAQDYDLVIIGSRASDDFFERIRSALPFRMRDKFRLYSRSFFNRFKRRPDAIGTEQDDRDAGWQDILRTHGVNFVTRARVLGDDFKYIDRNFHWSRLVDFIRDERVTVID
ncbi:MAG TPA: hypothetical protein VMX57_01470 [Planctomycetota bacterium]|nr:hypothetical protein [Planctomycetota bacterium]